MSTKDCLVALNKCLDRQPHGYGGNRKFKRVRKFKDDQGRVVREFQDDKYLFQMVGDGPSYEIFRAPGSISPTPQPVPGQEVVGYYYLDEMGLFTLVLKDFWEEHQGVDPDAADDLSERLPPDFYCMADATFEYDGDTADAEAALVSIGFISKDLRGDPTPSAPKIGP